MPTTLKVVNNNVTLTTGLRGQNGVDGVDGQATDHRGQGAPSDTLGVDGETYLDLVNGDTYEKVAGTWGSPVGSIQGPAGDIDAISGAGGLTVLAREIIEYATPEDYGWAGDGTPNATAEANLFAANVPIRFPRGGHYALTNPAVATSSLMVFEEGAHLDSSALTAGEWSLTIAGSQSASTALTADAAEGAFSVTVTSNTGISAGSPVRIASDGIYDPVQTSSKIGELNWVVDVSGTTITLLFPLEMDYTQADSARLHPVTPKNNVVLENPSIVGSEAGSKDLGGILIDLAVKPVIYSADVELCALHGIRYQDCLGGEIYSLKTRGENDIGNNNNGVSMMGATRDVTVVGHSAYRNRHAFTTNNSANAGREGVVRNIIYRDFNVYNTAKSGGGTGGDALDTHAASHGVTFQSGTVHAASGQGINNEGSKCHIIDVNIKSTLNHAVNLSNITSHDGDMLLRNVDCEDIAGDLVQIRNHQSSATGTISTAVISGLRGRNYTGKVINTPNTVTADMNITYEHIDCDATDVTETVGQIFIDTAQNIHPGPSISIRNLPAALAHTRIENSPLITGPGDLGYAHYETGTNTSASAFQFRSDASLTVKYPPLSARIEATATNTAKCFFTDANIQDIEFKKADGNANAELSITSGSTYAAEFEKRVVRTISSGSITIHKYVEHITVDTEASASSDDLDEILGTVAGQMISLSTASNSRDVTIKDNVSNLQTNGSVDSDLDASRDLAVFVNNGSALVQLALGDNA